MNRQQRLQLERLNDRLAEIGEGLKALGDLIEAADVDNAPMPYQLACLIRTVCQATSDMANKMNETLKQDDA